jgi:hypothetical protein
MGKFDDSGIFSPNKYKKKDSHPSHTGVINISYDTLKALNLQMKDTGEAKLEVAGWRKRDKPDMISLKISLPKEREDSGGRSRDRDDDRGERSRGSVRRDDDDRGERRSARRDDDDYDRGERRSSRRDDDDEIPFDDRRSSRRETRGRDRDDEGDERDL